MFCPKCGVKNLEDVKFCRACGTDIHLVPQALAGSLASETKKEKVSKRAEPPTLEKGFENIFGSVAFFIIVALGYVYFRNYFFIWVWFLIPALEHLGKGIGQLIRAGQAPPALAAPQVAPQVHASTDTALHGVETPALPAADTSEIVPPSVTEQTTRSLGAAAPRATR